MYNYDEMVQRIKNNKKVLIYLRICYLNEIDTDSFQVTRTDCCYKCGVRENEAYAMYFATRIPEDPCREEIMREIEKIEAQK